MDFFTTQDRTKSTTRKLIILYLFAVIALVISVYAATLILFATTGGAGISAIWIPELFIGVSFITCSVIAIGTLFRVNQLKKGGSAVAEMIGGRKVSMSTTDVKERRLINVVEEMSIASGIPIPDIYVLDHEPSINAFAAGYSIRDAAVGVTMGTLDHLNRDELQGVIAHEFSHIFNGDMRINIRLIGILNGILLIHLMGLMITRGGAYSRIGSSGRGKNQGGIIIFGIALLILGYIGMMFGRMIQSAVSRQREYLADASAVQYTRNPDGLAGALHKIAAFAEDPSLKDPHAMEVSHLFFSSSFRSGLDSLFATHPPIDKRIKSIGSALQREDVIRRSQKTKDTSTGRKEDDEEMDHLDPKWILAAIGTMSSESISQAGQMLSSLPDQIKEAIHEPVGAQSLIFSLLLSGDLEIETAQVEQINELCGPEVEFSVLSLKNHLNKIDPDWKLQIAELSIPALKEMSKSQYHLFRTTITKLIASDSKVSLFEFAIEKMITHQVEVEFIKKSETKVIYNDLHSLSDEFSLLLSAISHDSDEGAEAAWSAAMGTLDEKSAQKMKLLSKSDCTFEAVDQALEELGKSSGAVKKAFLDAALHAITHDGVTNRAEIKWVRAMAVAIDCPLPLFY